MGGSDAIRAASPVALVASKGSLAIFWSNALVGTLTALGVLLLCWPLIALALGRMAASRKPADAFDE